MTAATFPSERILVDESRGTELPASWLLDSINRAWMMHIMHQRHMHGQPLRYQDVQKAPADDQDFELFDGSALMALGVLVEEFVSSYSQLPVAEEDDGDDDDLTEENDSQLDSFDEYHGSSSDESVGDTEGGPEDADDPYHDAEFLSSASALLFLESYIDAAMKGGHADS